MHLFEFIVRTDRRAAAIWEKTPKLYSRGAMLLKRKLTIPDIYSSPPSSVELAAVPWLKLSNTTQVPPEILLLLRSGLVMDDCFLKKILDSRNLI